MPTLGPMRSHVTLAIIIALCWSFIAAAEPPSLTYKTVVVKPGDTMGRLARRYGTTVDDLLSANSLKNPDRLFAGQKLKIPQVVQRETPAPSPSKPEVVAPAKVVKAKKQAKPSATESSATSPRREVAETSTAPTRRRAAEKHVLLKHWVREGESVSDIAQTYGVSPKSIIETNGIHRPNAIPAGMVLDSKRQDPAPKSAGDAIPKTIIERWHSQKIPMRLTSRRVIRKRSSAQKKTDPRSLARPKRQRRLGAIVSP